MKKFLLLGAFALFAIPLAVFAQTGDGFVSLTSIPGLTDSSVATTPHLVDFLNNLYKFLIGLAAAITVIQIIRGGIMYATQDSIQMKSSGRAIIEQSLLGLLLVLAPVFVFTIINPSILNLNLNAPPITLSKQAGVLNNPTNPDNINNAIPVDGQPVVRNGATVVTKVFITDTEANAFVAGCTPEDQFHGYFKGGLPGWFTSGSECTANGTIINGSSVTNKCVLYKYTGYCSQVVPVTAFLHINSQLTLTTSNMTGISSNGFVYGDASTKFVAGCVTQDGGSLQQASLGYQTIKEVVCPPPTDPTFLDSVKKTGIQNGKCYQEYLFCRLSS